MVVLAFFIALIAAWRFIPHVRIFSLRMGWADEPNSRRLNEEPLPNAGGLAIFAAVIVALVIAILFHSIGLKSVQVQILAILLGGSFMIIAGFIDDQFHLPPIFRLLVQVFATLLLIASGIKIDIHATSGFFHNPGFAANALLNLLTILWIVGITNAFNLIDGVDGLAGGVAFITSMSLLSVAAQFEDRAAAVLLMAALAGAALGFLRHNFPPSRIIMGDSGAYFFGFVIAASSILGSLKTTTIFALFPTLLFLLLPVVDTSQVILRRLMRRANPLSSPGKDHLHHRLLARGLSHTRTTLVLWGVTLCTNIVAMAIQPQMRPLNIVVTVLIIFALLGWVIWRRQRALRRATLRTMKPEIPEIPEGQSPEPIRDDYSV
jgi:UDP-GlcNAc:undecaprenyl-phosphate GlcNAc-1-phosphate transferase